MNYKKLHQSILLMTLFCLFIINKTYAQNYTIIEPGPEHYSSKSLNLENRTTPTLPTKNVITNNAEHLNKAFNLSNNRNVVTSQAMVNCYIPPDASYLNFPGNDDGSIGPIPLPFTFSLYGINYTSVYINNNGNLTFTAPSNSFDPVGFPTNIPMVAPFWADVDTRVGNTVKYKINPTNLIVTWPGVGYYNQNVSKLNTFQVVISNGNDPLIGLGNNVAFYYGDMQWTTGEALSNGGTGGFGGVPATAGINQGDGINFIQIGRFNQNNTNYGGPLSGTSGINYLDLGCYPLTAGSLTNLQPAVSGVPANNTINIACGETGTINLTALPPEVGQNVSVVVNTGGLCNTTQTTTSGTSSNATVAIAGDACNEGTHNISFVFTDNFNPSASTTVNITVVIGTAPVITCPANITVSNTTGQCGANVSFAATATGSLAPTLTYSPASGSFFPVGTTTVTATATNACGTDTCTFTVTVNDTESPVVTCPGNQTLPVGSNCLVALPDYVTTSSVNLSVRIDNGFAATSCVDGFLGGSPEPQWRVNVNNQGWVTYPSSGICFANTPNTQYTQAYNCSNDYPPNVSVCFRVFEDDGAACIVSESCLAEICQSFPAPAPGSSATYSLTIPNSAPSWGTVNFTITSTGAFTNCPAATDNCSATVTQSPLPGTPLAPGNHTVTLNATDPSGNTDSCTFNVLVIDTTAPMINCPPNITGVLATSINGAVVNYPTPLGFDNCSGATTTRIAGLASGSIFPIGTTTVTHQVTNAAGLTAQCSFNVTVVGVAPQIACPSNITVNNAANQCGAIVSFTATETVGIPASTITYSPASGSLFPVGTTTVTATATNTVGSSSCTFTVTVNDTQPPSITCAAPISVQCPSDVVLTPPTASDNCALGLIYGPEMATEGGFDFGGSYWYQCGNNVEAYGSEAGYGGSNPFNTVAEIDHEPVSLCQSINGFVVGQTYQLTFRASRRSGAPSTVGADIAIDGGALSTTVTRSNTIFDLTLETFTFVATQTTHQLTFVPSSGWSGTVGFIVDDITIKKASTFDNNAPANFPYGDTTVTWSVVDASGNTATCTQLVSVNDTIAPSITCAPAVVVNNTPGLCTGTATLGTPTVDDNCSVGNALGFDGGSNYVVSDMDVSETNYTAEMWFKTTNGDCGLFMVSNFNQGYDHDRHIYLSGGDIRVRTWTDETISTSGTNYADGNWHHVAHTLGAGGQKIYVDGILKASGIKSQSDFYWQANIHIGFSWDSPNNYFQGIIDEVRVWNVARTQAEIQANMNNELNTQANLQAVFHFNQGIADGNNAGINTATDASGNGYSGALYNFALNGSISNWTVGKVKNITVINNAPAAFALGTNTVTWTATDSSGNTAICTQTVTVNDTEAPTIACPANITVNNTANQCGANVSFAATASDNCGTANVTYSPASGSFFAVGTTTVTATADDGHGNTTSCNFTVTVNDNQPPVINCPGNINVDMNAGVCGATVTFAATASDNCGTANITYSPASGSFFALGTTTVTATADDGHGNTTSCTFTVTVDLLDHVNLQWPPNATICPGGTFTAYGQVYEPNVTTVNGQQGANIEVQFGYNSSNTNPSTWSNWSPASFNQFGGGPNNDEYFYNFSSNVPGTYYYTFRYRQNGCTWQYGGFQQWDGGTWDGTNYVSGVLTVQSLDWANLQWPPNARICQGSSMTAYGQVYETGLTIGAGAQGAGIDVQFGYSTTNTNPSGWSNWSTASFNQFGGGSANDEYYYNFTPPTSGTYYYTFRYRLNGCLWQYGGYTSGGGYFWDGTNSVSGRLVVDPTTVGGAVSGGTSICPGETSALLTLSGYTGDILGWESSVFPFLSWTPIGNNNNTYTSGPLAETTKFRAILQSGVCSSVASADTTVIVYLTYPFYADNDDDGYGAGASVLLCSDDANNAPEGYSVDGTDCDDTLADRHETFPFFVDADGDSYGAEGSTAVQLCAVDGNTPPESNYSVNDDDCNDLVFAINPSVAEIPFDNIDNNCNGTLYDGHPLIVVHVLSPSCGGINHGLNNTINCTEIDLGAGFVIGYRFKVTNLSTGQVDYVDTVQHHFKLTDTDIYAYGTSYSIQVAAIVNGEVQGYNGSTCTLTTTNVATTKVVNSQCGSTLLFMNSTINANAVNSAISYRFRVARADAPTVYYYTGERNLPNFNLTMLTVPVGFLTYDTEYKVDVQIKIKLANIIAWSQFGQVCSIFTPVPPTSAIITSQCELVASSYTQVINATPFAGATVYRFLLTHYDEFGELDYEQYQDSPTPSFTLSMFTGLLPDTTYNVSVAMQLYGTFVPYDKECTVTTPIAARIIETTAFKATVYPNPYTNNFMIEVKTADAALIDIKVYDMVGRLVEQRTVKVSDLEKAPIGERYPSGVYNVIVSQGDNIQTVRVVRR